MAIVEMKKMTLLAALYDREGLFLQMQKLGCVQVIAGDEGETGPYAHSSKARSIELSAELERLCQAIEKLEAYDKAKKKIIEDKPTPSEDQILSIRANEGELFSVVSRVEKIEEDRLELRSRTLRLNALVERLAPLVGFDIPLERVRDTETCKIKLLTLPEWNCDAFFERLSNTKTLVLKRIGPMMGDIYVFLMVHLSEADEVESAIRAFRAKPVDFPGIRGTPEAAMEAARASLREMEKQRRRYMRDLEEFARGLPYLRFLRDLKENELSRLRAEERCLRTKSAFLMRGWVPAVREKEVRARLKAVSSSCEVEFADPAEGDRPPTLLSNKGVAAPFEMITRMFSTPDARGFDPTFAMMPFWVCFFGMMLADAGYGAALAVAAALLLYKLKGRGVVSKMAAILALGGLSTIFWGALYGEWFFVEGIRPLWFAPMENPVGMLVLCLALGVLQIFFGMGLQMHINIKRGRFLDAVCDQGFWMILLIALLVLPIHPASGAALLILGGLGVLLTADRSGHNKPIKRVLLGLGRLWGVRGYVSDVISYARLFGIGLAAGAVGLAVNRIAMMLMVNVAGTVAAVSILIIGHAFNLAIHVLLAYVNSCRLQYGEFFGKFFEEGGAEFAPLREEPGT